MDVEHAHGTAVPDIHTSVGDAVPHQGCGVEMERGGWPVQGWPITQETAMKMKYWKKPANCRLWVWMTLMLSICAFSLLLIGVLIPGRILN